MWLFSPVESVDRYFNHWKTLRQFSLFLVFFLIREKTTIGKSFPWSSTVCFARSCTVCQDLQVITEAHLNPVGADNGSVKVTFVCASLLHYGHLDAESCASDPTAPQVSLAYPVADKELGCRIGACRGSGSLGRLGKWCLVFSGVLCAHSRSSCGCDPSSFPGHRLLGSHSPSSAPLSFPLYWTAPHLPSPCSSILSSVLGLFRVLPLDLHLLMCLMFGAQSSCWLGCAAGNYHNPDEYRYLWQVALVSF